MWFIFSAFLKPAPNVNLNKMVSCLNLQILNSPLSWETAQILETHEKAAKKSPSNFKSTKMTKVEN